MMRPLLDTSVLVRLANTAYLTADTPSPTF